LNDWSYLIAAVLPENSNRQQWVGSGLTTFLNPGWKSGSCGQPEEIAEF
jgi:hypothetical protein